MEALPEPLDISFITTPYQNVITLLEQYVKLQNKKKELEKDLQMIPSRLDTIDQIESMEDELKHIISYSRTIMDQATVIINENNIYNVPSLDDISLKLLT